MLKEKKLEIPYTTQLLLLHELAVELRNRRIINGAVIFEKPDINVRVKGDEITVTRIEKDSLSKMLISEFMILANHLMAKFTDEHKISVIYRIQDSPREEIPAEQRILKEYNPVLFRNLMMKFPSSKFSLYSSQHSSVGVSGYSQFTSPIRRYNDFLTMRQLSTFFNNEPQAYDHNEMLLAFIDIEKKINQIKTLQNSVKSQYLLKYLTRYSPQEKFTAIITKTTRSGYIAELSDYLVSGFLSCMKQLEPGDIVQIYIDSIDAGKNKLWLKI